MTDDEKNIKACNGLLRILSAMLFIFSVLSGWLGKYDLAAWTIGIAIFIRILASE